MLSRIPKYTIVGVFYRHHDTGMPFARDVYVDVCFVQVADAGTLASTFGGLIYKILILRPELVAVINEFATGLVSHSMIDARRVHQGGLQVLCRYLQDVCNNLLGSVWTYTEEGFGNNSTIFL